MAIVTKEIWVTVAYERVFEKVVVVAYTCTRSSCYKRVEHTMSYWLKEYLELFTILSVSSYKDATK